MVSVSRIESLDGLSNEWNELVGRSKANRVFSTWEWHSTWWQCFGQGAEFLALAARQDGRLVGIAPLFKRGERVGLMGGTDVSDYLDVIIASGWETEVLNAFLEYLVLLPWTAMEVQCLRCDSMTLTTLPRLASDHGLVVEVVPMDVCPRVSLPATWDEYLARLSKKDRHELRRKIRRLESAGPVRWHVANVAVGLDSKLDSFLNLMRVSHSGKAAFMDERMERFFRAMAERVRDRGELKLYFLEIEDKRVAGAMCFDQGDELLLYNSGFDRDYGHLSVGLLLKAFCLRDAIATGKKEFDFLRGEEPYKYDLGGVDQPIYRLEVRRG